MPTHFKLILEGDTVYLVVCNPDGRVVDGGYILGFQSDGMIFRQPSVRAERIQVDENGKIVERMI